MRRFDVILAGIFYTALLTASAAVHAQGQTQPLGQPLAQPAAQDQDLRRHLTQDLLNHHADRSAAVNAQNVGQLNHAWTIETPANVTHTPLIDGDRVYFADWAGTVYAANADTGEVLWQNNVEQPKTQWPWHGFAGTGAQSRDTLFEASVEGNLFALDKQSGELLWQTRFVTDGQAGNVGRLTYFDGVVFVPVQSVEEALAKMKPGFTPDFQGHVLAVDAANGQILWNQPLVTVPHNGVPVWTGFALDPQTDTLYFATGNNYTGEATALSDSLVAADARTGSIKWHRQVFHHDVWTMAEPRGPDYDFSASPQIFIAPVAGRPRKLVAAGNKSGTYFVWDAATGEPVWSSTIGYGSKGGGMHAEASIGGGRIFLWGNNSYFYKHPEQHPMDIAAVDAATGRWLWVRPKAQPAALTSAGFLANDVYFVASLDGQVRGYDASNGNTIWTSGKHGSIGSSVWVDGGRLLFGTGVPERFGGIAKGQGLVAYSLAAEGSPATQPRRQQGGAAQGQAQDQSQSQDGVREVRMIATDYDFQPKTLTVASGQKLRVMLVNRGSVPHNIEFELPSGEVEFEQVLEPGNTRALTFTAPTEPGKYTYYCPVANHHQRGMEGTLVVQQQ